MIGYHGNSACEVLIGRWVTKGVLILPCLSRDTTHPSQRVSCRRGAGGGECLRHLCLYTGQTVNPEVKGGARMRGEGGGEMGVLLIMY